MRHPAGSARKALAGGQRNPLHPPVIKGEMAARDTDAEKYARGERVFHEKFGYGVIRAVDGNKLTIDFDKAGEKRVIDSFVSRG